MLVKILSSQIKMSEENQIKTIQEETQVEELRGEISEEAWEGTSKEIKQAEVDCISKLMGLTVEELKTWYREAEEDSFVDIIKWALVTEIKICTPGHSMKTTLVLWED
mgnify:CR=1 FL=1